MLLLKLMLLLLAANGAPILLYDWWRGRWAWPIDGGRLLGDGRPLLGASKTWRGLLVSMAVCAMLAPLLGWSALIGAQFGLYAMLGDLFSSFVKRRLGIAPMGRAPGLDQIPEALLPLFLLRDELGVTLYEVVVLVLLFFILEQILSILLFRLHLRQRPY